MKKLKTYFHWTISLPVIAAFLGLSTLTIHHLSPELGIFIALGVTIFSVMFFRYIRHIENGFREKTKTQQDEILRRRFAEAQLTEAKKRMEATNVELRKTQHRHQLHIEQTPLGVIHWSNTFTIEAWNPSAELIFGYSAAEAIGRTANELIVPPDIQTTIDEVCENLLHETGPSVNRNENVTKDGRRIICQWYNTPLVNDDGVVIGVSSIVQDISKEQQYEYRLQKAKEHAEAANRAKSRFMANMSHELRTPMNAIMGFAELLKEESLNDSQLDYVETIHTSSRHLLRLINDVLDISKIEAGKEEISLGVCSLREMLGQLEDLMDNEAQNKGLDFVLDIRDDVPNQIISDAKHLYQCLINLVGNAIKFTETGSVSLGVGMLEDAAQTRMFFEVIDTGIGIAPERQDKVFESFEQADIGTSRKYGGTGLGLTITRQLVEMMGGTITLESQVERGTTFTIVLPIQQTSCPVTGSPS